MSEPSRELLVSIPPLQGATVVGRLGAGQASESWRLRAGGEDLVLRIDRPLAPALGLDRDSEWRVLEVAHGGGLGPEPLWHDARRGLLLTVYLPGKTWSAADLSDPARLDALARLLRRVHSLPGVGKDFDPVVTGERYAQAAGLTNDERLKTVSRLAEELYAPELERQLCHMDPHAGNLIGRPSGGRPAGEAGPWLIDWEYAAAGDPLFDLAVVTCYHDLPPPSASRLLDAWNGGHEPLLAERFNAMRQLYATLTELWEAAVDQSR